VVLDSDGFVQYRLDEGLLTRDAVSESVGGGQVLGSIVMFGFIYALLFLIWLFVLNDKIQKGPQPVHPQSETTARQFFDTAARRTLHEGSLSEAKEP
jgi:cytochrome bd ubiquinol oxidase subunit I